MNTAKLKSVNKICRILKSNGKSRQIFAEGIWGSFPVILADSIRKKTRRPVCHISPHIDTAENLSEDIKTLTGSSALYFPAWESEPDLTETIDETGSERIRITLHLDEHRNNSKKKI